MKKLKFLLPLTITFSTVPFIASCAAFPNHADEVVRFVDHGNAESISINVTELDHPYSANFKVLHDQARNIEYSYSIITLKQETDLHVELKRLEGQSTWQCTFQIDATASKMEISSVIQIRADFINSRNQKCTSYCFLTVEKAKQEI